MLVFLENGDLKGPIDYLNEWNADKWERAYRQLLYSREAMAKLEQILAELRELAQMHSDLLHHPGRTSNDENEQNIYWNLYYPWYSRTLPRSLRRIKTYLDRFWAEGPGKDFHDHYPEDSDDYQEGSVVCHTMTIFESQFDVLEEYHEQFTKGSTNRMIRLYLNPTGSGARVLTTGEHPRIPVILTLR